MASSFKATVFCFLLSTVLHLTLSFADPVQTSHPFQSLTSASSSFSNLSLPLSSVSLQNTSLSSGQLTCWHQPVNPATERLRPVNLSDCLQVLYNIMKRPSALFPVMWDPRLQSFPVWNTFGTCAIGLIAKTPMAQATFPDMLVAHVAAILLGICVEQKAGEKLGGRCSLGEGGFDVAIYGWYQGGGAAVQ